MRARQSDDPPDGPRGTVSPPLVDRGVSGAGGVEGGAGSGSRPPPRVPPRGVLFALLCAVCLAVMGGYVARASRRAAPSADPATTTLTGSASGTTLGARPAVVFRSTALDASYGKVGVIPLDDPGGPRSYTPLECDRVYVADGHGLCLAAHRGVLTTYTASLFDGNFRPGPSFPLAGEPSRARVSPDGRYAAMTVFVAGDGYSSPGFSTRTTIVDTATGSSLGDLEQFAVTRDGAPFKAVDFNFWGVTFARDDEHFYATLASGGETYLLQGDLPTRSARVLRENVECPSLSPDGTRLAFKKLTTTRGRRGWQLTVLDLGTLRETPLAETRSVDDQAEWLDDAHVLYALPGASQGTAATDVWEVPADGSGAPRLFLANAYSPAVVR